MIERIQRRAFRFVDMGDVDIANSGSMEVKRLRTLAIEIFKTLNNLNPIYMQEIFKKSDSRFSERLKLNLNGQRFKQIRYGKNSLRVRYI